MSKRKWIRDGYISLKIGILAQKVGVHGPTSQVLHTRKELWRKMVETRPRVDVVGILEIMWPEESKHRVGCIQKGVGVVLMEYCKTLAKARPV